MKLHRNIPMILILGLLAIVALPACVPGAVAVDLIDRYPALHWLWGQWPVLTTEWVQGARRMANRSLGDIGHIVSQILKWSGLVLAFAAVCAVGCLLS